MQRPDGYRIAYGMALTGLAISLALHIASFALPAIADYGIPISIVYTVVVLASAIATTRVMRNPLGRGAPPPAAGAAMPPVPRAPVPGWLRLLSIIQTLLFLYSLIWVVQMCTAPDSGAGAMNVYLVRSWSGLGLAIGYRWALLLAARLGWLPGVPPAAPTPRPGPPR